MARSVPQPAVDRMVHFGGRPVVVGIVPGQPDLVVLTALSLARAIRAPALHLAYVDAAVVGTRAHGATARLRGLFEGSVAAHLSHHQHRPVLTVTLSVVDWNELPAPWGH
ncbi:hypothetical protein LEP48_12740 [Isoptericola sp. NEAU-Y5]|uniref:UspA domain-containing protein n=1 Tax=Isoptericola luteus TaxID=2879484 RepID=A0ABS7ZH10_9MICO|nr:hypothetical protein [Isoptericola sp. NEAU-Y5]MCA5894208.1 hypothetical protein [Isoptericola sp. NEAU-Y5]